MVIIQVVPFHFITIFLHYLAKPRKYFAGTVIRDDMGLTLEKADKDVLGTATKVVITKDSTLIVTDGSTQEAVTKRVTQLQRLVEVRHFFFSLRLCKIYVFVSQVPDMLLPSH